MNIVNRDVLPDNVCAERWPAAASEHPLHGVAVGERGFDLGQGGAYDAEDRGRVTRYDSA